MKDISHIINFLQDYDGEEIRIMEVCGTHTAAISENGIPEIISPKIKLISGPGCPVCVTVAEYIDRLCELSLAENTCVATFGDMIRVRGHKNSLADMKAHGARVKMLYSPLELLDIAKADPNTTYIFAAVGFETTTPIYALLMDGAIAQNIKNIKLLTALKTMPAVISQICEDKERKIDGFLAPGHVSSITGSNYWTDLATKYSIPFVVGSFEGAQLLGAIYALVKLCGNGQVVNLYPSAVNANRNEQAAELVSKYFTPCDSAWRGLGIIENSGMAIRSEYGYFDAGSMELNSDELPGGCSCASVITGKCAPNSCPLFGKVCTPEHPYGACMVSTEGSCFNYYVNKRKG